MTKRTETDLDLLGTISFVRRRESRLAAIAPFSNFSRSGLCSHAKLQKVNCCCLPNVFWSSLLSDSIFFSKLDRISEFRWCLDWRRSAELGTRWVAASAGYVDLVPPRGTGESPTSYEVVTPPFIRGMQYSPPGSSSRQQHLALKGSYQRQLCAVLVHGLPVVNWCH